MDGRILYIFICAFGLSKQTDVCDLVPLFEIMMDSRRQPDPFIDRVGEAAHAGPRTPSDGSGSIYLSKVEASVLYQQLLRDESLITKTTSKVANPSSFTTSTASVATSIPLAGYFFKWG